MDPLLKEKLCSSKKGDVFELYFVTFEFAGNVRFEITGAEKYRRFDEYARREPVWLSDGSKSVRYGNSYIHKRLQCNEFVVGEEKFKAISIYENNVLLHGELSYEIDEDGHQRYSMVDYEVFLIDPETEGAEEMVIRVKRAKAVCESQIATTTRTFDPSCQRLSAKVTKLVDQTVKLATELKEAQRELDSTVEERDTNIRDANRAFGSVIEAANREYAEKQCSKRQCITNSDN